jgi:hypothetical protein
VGFLRLRQKTWTQNKSAPSVVPSRLPRHAHARAVARSLVLGHGRTGKPPPPRSLPGTHHFLRHSLLPDHQRVRVTRQRGQRR